jgi:hypothetical protein
LANLRLNSKQPTTRQKPTEPGRQTLHSRTSGQTDRSPFKCKCGDPQCGNEWHRLAMWLAQDRSNYGRLIALIEEQIAGSAANDVEQD